MTVRVPGRAFPDNAAVGAFVAVLLARPGAAEALSVAAPAPPPSASQALMQQQLERLQQPRPQQPPRALVVDRAVYTKNRQFRLATCCKGGKAARLLPTARFATAPPPAPAATAEGEGGAAAAAPTASSSSSPLSEEQVLLLSLVCNVHPAAAPLDVGPLLAEAAALAPQRGAGGAARAAHGRVVEEGVIQVPLAAAAGAGAGGTGDGPAIVAGAAAPAGAPPGAYRAVKVTRLHGRAPDDAGAGAAGAEDGAAAPGAAGAGADDSAWRAELQRAALRALPFVERVAAERAGGLPAHVRALTYCGGDGAVAYSMLGDGSHMCLRIGRPHRRNHVFFVVDFGTGQFCQKCYDPDCHGWRSPWLPLPADVWRRDALAALVEARAAAAAAAAALAGAAAVTAEAQERERLLLLEYDAAAAGAGAGGAGGGGDEEAAGGDDDAFADCEET